MLHPILGDAISPVPALDQSHFGQFCEARTQITRNLTWGEFRDQHPVDIRETKACRLRLKKFQQMQL